MKAYTGYSRSGAKENGAVLVFANSAKEARVLTWHDGLVVDEWIDTAVQWLKDRPWLFKEATSDKPHVVDSPRTCVVCHMWGNLINENGICSDHASTLEVK